MKHRLNTYFRTAVKTKIIFALVTVFGWKIEAQTPTNLPSSPPAVFEPAQPQPITNKNSEEKYAVSPEDVKFLRSKGFSDDQIAQVRYEQKPQTNNITLSPTPPDLKNAMVFVDNFLGGGKTGFPADVISIKKGMLKFRFGGKDFDYSGNFSVLLTTPRQHKNPYLGFGKPETAKLLTLGDFFKGETDGTMILQDATIWEKSDGFIDAEAFGKEWILSGNYSISN